jgi:hypothetical protein
VSLAETPVHHWGQNSIFLQFRPERPITPAMQPKSQKNQKSKGPEGFETKDGYAAVPWGKRLVILYNGEQLEDVSTVLQAQKFIKNHRSTPKTGTVFLK